MKKIENVCVLIWLTFFLVIVAVILLIINLTKLQKLQKEPYWELSKCDGTKPVCRDCGNTCQGKHYPGKVDCEEGGECNP